MIYDCFSFFNELDLLEIRLNVLDGVVDKFVLAEATLTHTGKPKPLYYQENRERFAKFADKIIHIVVDDFPEPPIDFTEAQMSWMRENWQRNGIFRGLSDAADDDLVMISDVDEIPDPKVLRQKRDWTGITAFGQIYANFYFNFIDQVRPVWHGTRLIRMKDLRASERWRINVPHYAVIDMANEGFSPTRVRYAKPDRKIENAGWHFSYLGGAEAALRKIHSVGIEHSVRYGYTVETVDAIIASGHDITGGGGRFFVVPFDGRFPAYLRAHADRYGKYVRDVENGYFRRTLFPRLWCRWRGFVRRNGARLIPRCLKQPLFDLYCKVVRDPIRT